MQWAYRFIVGGLIVSLFAVIGDVLRPKGFAGLFGAAPSVALATLALTVMADGKAYAAVEARSMAAGAIALLVYAVSCLYFMARRHWKATVTTCAMLTVWGTCAFGLWALVLRRSP